MYFLPVANQMYSFSSCISYSQLIFYKFGIFLKVISFKKFEDFHPIKHVYMILLISLFDF